MISSALLWWVVKAEVRVHHCLSQIAIMQSAHCRVGLLGEQLQGGEELFGLADEEAIIGQGFGRSHRRACRAGGADDGDGRELATEEDGRFGHDKVGLEVLAAKGWGVEVGEDKSIGGVG